ncbi:Glycoside hydrolase superfamily [Penicillium concentricum]|uniref:cellulase n=1 Tax=Penicillium concentricum TaxID=293559 RepID=A0A9W9S792_9EURO|nr:Glycoside hydrolase superfamily [Penicillium concentricum]KAJ5373278.1 Glycoside hydrolase superfamily [Penicillium concentricum]
MKFTNIVLAASAATVACAYPRGRDVIPTKQTTDIKKRANGFTWLGVSESGAEFGPGNTPGTLDKDYTWPKTSQIKILRDAGMNIFRVPFLMERLVPSSMTGSPDATYMAALKSTVKFITDSGAYAVLDPHNYGRYGGNIITSTSDFKAFWKTVAKEFASNEKVVFDTNNEYHDLDQTLVLDLNQAAIDAIRAAGATSQYIFVEGNAWSGAHSWTANNDNLKALTDSEDKIVYEMHQYLDGDSSGTSPSCVSATIGKERLESATAWLQKNHKKGFIGEFAGGVNSVCESAVEGMLSYMSDNSDVWMGAEWWAAGPWWGSYMYSLEPADGPAYATYLPILEKYFTAAKTTTTTAQTSTKTAAHTTTTTADVKVTTTANPNIQVPSATSSSTTTAPAKTTTAAVVAPISTTTLVKVPTTTTAAPTTLVTATTHAQVPTGTPSTGNVAKHYYQCGGINWTGPTVCETGTTCREWNPYYFQCVSPN